MERELQARGNVRHENIEARVLTAGPGRHDLSSLSRKICLGSNELEFQKEMEREGNSYFWEEGTVGGMFCYFSCGFENGLGVSPP